MAFSLFLVGDDLCTSEYTRNSILLSVYAVVVEPEEQP